MERWSRYRQRSIQLSFSPPSLPFLLPSFLQFGSIQFSLSVMSDSLWPHGLQHTRLLCPSPSLRACSHSCPLSWWCHPTISSSVAPFSFCLPSFSASRSFPMSRFFASGAEIFGASALASVLPVNIHGWFLLGLTGLISLQSKGLSRVFSSTMIWKHQFCAQPSLCRVINTCPHGTCIPVGDRKTTPKKKKRIIARGRTLWPDL